MTTPDLSKLTIDRSEQAHVSHHARHRRWLRIAGFVALAIVVAGVSRTLVGKPSVDVVSVVLAYPAQNYTLLNATGYAVAQRKAAISSKATGRLEWLGVLEGSRVRKGELIARLENRDVAAALGQAQAGVRLAQANLEQANAELFDAERANQRAGDLLAQNFISHALSDAALARRNKARAGVSAANASIAVARASAQGAQVALDQTMIRAPFDGVILTKNANVGDNITPFSAAADSKGAVVTLADMDTLEVEADVSESNLAKIRVEQPAEIQLDAFPELRLAGVVSRTVPTVDRSKATLLVKVRFVERDARVLPDMSAKVAFLSKPVPPEDRKAVTSVRPGALVQRDGKTVAFVFKDDKLRLTVVTTGRRIGELIEVSGLAAGDKVVLNPADKLADAMHVNLSKK